MSDRHWISAFLEAQSAERGAAHNTQLAYARDLRDYAEWLAGGDADLPKQRARMSRATSSARDAQGLSKATRARRLSAIKQLYRFAFEEGLRADNPAIQISGPGRDKRLPKTLSTDEVDRLLDAATRHGRGRDEMLRNTCLMQLLYATGMRVTELVSLPLRRPGAIRACC